MEFDLVYVTVLVKSGCPEFTTFYHPYAVGKFRLFSSSECESESTSSVSVTMVEYLPWKPCVG